MIKRCLLILAVLTLCGCSTTRRPAPDVTGQAAARAFAASHEHGVPLDSHANTLPVRRSSASWAHADGPGPSQPFWLSSGPYYPAASVQPAPQPDYGAQQAQIYYQQANQLAAQINQANRDANTRQFEASWAQMTQQWELQRINDNLQSISDAMPHRSSLLYAQ